MMTGDPFFFVLGGGSTFLCKGMVKFDEGFYKLKLVLFGLVSYNEPCWKSIGNPFSKSVVKSRCWKNMLMDTEIPANQMI